MKYHRILCFLVLLLFPLLSLAEVVPPRRPNVLFIICDDLSTLALPCYGNPVVKTPNIDRLASMGERFERAYCQYPLCLPSRNSFLSGRRPDERFSHHELLRQFVPDARFLPEEFRKHGYFTARVGKIFHTTTIFNGAKSLDEPGCWDLSELGGIPSDPCGYAVVYSSATNGLPAHPELKPLVLDQELLNQAGQPAADYWMEMAVLKDGADTTDANIARRVSQLLDQRGKSPDGKPFFLAAGFRRPHLLWVAPKQCFDLYQARNMQLPQEPPEHLKDIPELAFTRRAPGMTDEQRRQAIAAYYACVTHVDHQLGVVLEAMDRNKLWKNTIVLFTSDHGWHLGNHGLWGKVTLFQEAAKVPLLTIAPGLTKPGTSCKRTVEMVDFFPTLTELAGIPTPEHLDGASLAPLLKDPQAPRDQPAYTVLCRRGVWGRSVDTEDFRYSEWGDNASKGVELYDLRNDPHEFHNLAHEPAQAVTRAKLKQLIDEKLKLHDLKAGDSGGD